MMANSDSKARIANGDVTRVGKVLEEIGSESVLLVSNGTAQENSGTESKLESFLSIRQVFYFTFFNSINSQAPAFP